MHDAEPAEVRVDRPVRPDPERAAFERWCGEDGRWPQAIERNGNGYKLMSTHSAWMAWRACWPQAQAAERERCAKLCEEVHADTSECPELALHCAARIRGA